MLLPFHDNFHKDTLDDQIRRRLMGRQESCHLRNTIHCSNKSPSYVVLLTYDGQSDAGRYQVGTVVNAFSSLIFYPIFCLLDLNNYLIIE